MIVLTDSGPKKSGYPLLNTPNVLLMYIRRYPGDTTVVRQGMKRESSGVYVCVRTSSLQPMGSSAAWYELNAAQKS